MQRFTQFVYTISLQIEHNTFHLCTQHCTPCRFCLVLSYPILSSPHLSVLSCPLLSYLVLSSLLLSALVCSLLSSLSVSSRVCVFLPVCLSVCLSVAPSYSLSLCPSPSLFLLAFRVGSLPACLPAWLLLATLCLPACLLACLLACLWLPACLFVCLSIIMCLFACAWSSAHACWFGVEMPPCSRYMPSYTDMCVPIPENVKTAVHSANMAVNMMPKWPCSRLRIGPDQEAAFPQKACVVIDLHM